MSTVPIEQYKLRATQALEVVYDKYDCYMKKEMFDRQCADIKARIIEQTQDEVRASDVIDWITRARRSIVKVAKECDRIQNCTNVHEAAGRMHTMYIQLQIALLNLSFARYYDTEPTVP